MECFYDRLRSRRAPLFWAADVLDQIRHLMVSITDILTTEFLTLALEFKTYVIKNLGTK